MLALVSASSTKRSRPSGKTGIGPAPVWSHDGGLSTGESYKQVVKLTFHRGAALQDLDKLFTEASLGFPRLQKLSALSRPRSCSVICRAPERPTTPP